MNMIARLPGNVNLLSANVNFLFQNECILTVGVIIPPDIHLGVTFSLVKLDGWQIVTPHTQADPFGSQPGLAGVHEFARDSPAAEDG